MSFNFLEFYFCHGHYLPYTASKKWQSPEFISRTLDIARKMYEKKIFVQNPV